MEMREWLVQAFEYDRWANRRWIDRVGRFRNGGKPARVFEHILTAQRTWLTRCGVHVEESGENEHIGAVADRLTNAWIMLVTDSELEEPIIYTNFAGETFENTLREIALHVVNHGTYHRGHLRGLADAEGLEEFQDTDLIHFLRE